MEEKKKVYNKIFMKIFFCFFFAFLTIYISGESGYYEFELHKKSVLTNEKMKEFESDVAAGKNVNIKDYMEEKEVNYSNNLSKLGLYLSENVGDIIKNFVDAAFDFLNKLFQG